MQNAFLFSKVIMTSLNKNKKKTERRSSPIYDKQTPIPIYKNFLVVSRKRPVIRVTFCRMKEYHFSMIIFMTYFQESL